MGKGLVDYRQQTLKDAILEISKILEFKTQDDAVRVIRSIMKMYVMDIDDVIDTMDTQIGNNISVY